MSGFATNLLRFGRWGFVCAQSAGVEDSEMRVRKVGVAHWIGLALFSILRVIACPRARVYEYVGKKGVCTYIRASKGNVDMYVHTGFPRKKVVWEHYYL